MNLDNFEDDDWLQQRVVLVDQGLHGYPWITDHHHLNALQEQPQRRPVHSALWRFPWSGQQLHGFIVQGRRIRRAVRRGIGGQYGCVGVKMDQRRLVVGPQRTMCIYIDQISRYIYE